MNTTTVFVIVALALLVLAFFTYMHKKHVRFNKEDLTLKTKKIFAGAGSIEEKKYLYGLRHEYDCSLKEAHYLFGKACENGIVKVEDKMVTLG